MAFGETKDHAQLRNPAQAHAYTHRMWFIEKEAKMQEASCAQNLATEIRGGLVSGDDGHARWSGRGGAAKDFEEPTAMTNHCVNSLLSKLSFLTI